ncbi:MAG: M48 family metalloprotease [Myxococcales bacterium]|nr:M48 family metalloprotease [Myxococcales bacterium]
MPSRIAILAFSAVALLSLACATNPVTGKKELVLIPEAEEIHIGQENYGPTRQMQGGDYTVDPELTSYVSEVGQRLAAVSDRPHLPYELKVLNSSVPNAWALPGGKIAINRGLLVELGNEAELAAVLGHEIVHAAARHGAKQVERGLLLQGAVIAAQIALSDEDYGGLVVVGAALGAFLVNQKYSRDAESEADLYGISYMHRAGYDPEAAATLQETFVRLSEGRSPNWLEGLFASHPPSRERVAANRAIAATLVAEEAARGELYANRYQERLAKLNRQKDSYDAYDRGRAALTEGRSDEALALARQALGAEPREPRFHTLRGDVRLQQQRYRDAVTDYERAIDLDGTYFLPYLRRGQARKALGDVSSARADLEHSLELLPTAEAHLELGVLAEERGDIDEALALYRAVGASDTEAGRAAGSAIARLDLPNHPGAYLELRPLLGHDGIVTIEVENRAPIAVRDVEIVIQRVNQKGRWKHHAQRVLRGEIPAESRGTWRTDIGPFETSADLESLRLRVVAAQPAIERSARIDGGP